MPTRNSDAQPARRGYILLATLVLAAIAIFNMEAISDLGRRDLHLVALVHEAPGVRAGTEVWVEGVKVGRVGNITIVPADGSSLAALDLRLQPRARALITPSSDVRASRQRLIGEPVIRISAGSPDERVVQDGDTLRARPRRLPAEILAEAAVLPILLDSLREAAAVVRATWEERRPHLERLSHQLQVTGDAANDLARQLERGSLARMLDGPASVANRVQELRARLVELSDALALVGERWGAEPGDGLGLHLDALAGRTRAVQSSLTDLEARIEAGDGFVGRVQQDTALQVAIRGVRLQIDSLVAEAHSIAFRMLLP